MGQPEEWRPGREEGGGGCSGLGLWAQQEWLRLD